MIEIGAPYFSPSYTEDGQTTIAYQGLVVGIIVKRDDGSEFEVREKEQTQGTSHPLTWQELQTIPLGAKVKYKNGKTFIVERVFPGQGCLWIRTEANDYPPFEVKHFEVTRVP